MVVGAHRKRSARPTAPSTPRCARGPPPRAGEDQVTPVAWFKDVGIADRPAVGGKGGSLGELTQAGIAVPPGFVVTTAAFELFLEALESRAPVRSKVAALDPGDLGAATKLSEQLRRRVI